MFNKQKLYENINNAVIEERLALFARNIEKNYDMIKKWGGLKSIVDRLKNKNVIVIGAGPSLSKSYNFLKKVSQRDDFVLISTDMALRPLVKKSVIPHFVVSCETKAALFFDGIDSSNMCLLSFACISPSNLRKWKGSIAFYNWMLEGEYNMLWDKSGRDLGFLATGSIVTTQAVSLALGCEIKSLLLCGNDLAFGWNFYAQGTVAGLSYEHTTDRLNIKTSKEAEIARRNSHYKIVRKNKFYFTNNQMLAAKTWLEDLFKNCLLSVFDCSEPGCSEASVKHIDFDDYLKIVKL